MKFILFAFTILFSTSCSLIVFPPTESKIRAKKGFEWIEQFSSDRRFTFMIEKGAIQENQYNRLEETVRIHLDRCIKFLDISDPNEKYTYVIVASRERVKNLIGVSPQATANPSKCLIVGDPAALQVAHELAHVVSIRFLGSSKQWIQEGVAVATDDHWFNYDLHALANHLRIQGNLLAMSELASNFKNYNTLITYPQAGSFIKFLKENYGSAKLKEFWKSGGSNADKIFGQDLLSIERAWIATISSNTSPINGVYKIQS